MQGDSIALVIDVVEKPRLNEIIIKGLKKSDKEDIKKKLDVLRGKPITDALKLNVKNTIADQFEEKSYLRPIIDIVEKKDEGLINSSSIIVNVDKGNKVKINEITFNGRVNGELSKMRKTMKDTRERTKIDLRVHDGRSRKQKAKDALYTLANLNSNSVKDFFVDRFRITFKGSKFNERKYEDDKQKLIDYYNNNGYRDAKIASDTVVDDEDGNVSIIMNLEEGNKYYFRNIEFKGNSKFSSDILARVLNIKKGDVYNAELLQKRISMDQDGGDISSLYYDDGYLFFSVNLYFKHYKYL